MAERFDTLVVGRRIRELREALGMSTEHLANLVGTDRPTISRIERDLAGLSFERACRIAAALGVEIQHLDTQQFPSLKAVLRIARRRANVAA